MRASAAIVDANSLPPTAAGCCVVRFFARAEEIMWRLIAVVCATTLAFAGFDTAFAAEDQASRATFTVALKEVDDLKSVYATVHSKDLIEPSCSHARNHCKFEGRQGDGR